MTSFTLCMITFISLKSKVTGIFIQFFLSYSFNLKLYLSFFFFATENKTGKKTTRQNNNNNKKNVWTKKKQDLDRYVYLFTCFFILFHFFFLSLQVYFIYMKSFCCYRSNITCTTHTHTKRRYIVVWPSIPFYKCKRKIQFYTLQQRKYIEKTKRNETKPSSFFKWYMKEKKQNSSSHCV